MSSSTKKIERLYAQIYNDICVCENVVGLHCHFHFHHLHNEITMHRNDIDCDNPDSIVSRIVLA